MPSETCINAEVGQAQTTDEANDPAHKREVTAVEGCVTVAEVPKLPPVEKIDAGRLDKLMNRAGIKSDVQLQKFIGAQQVGRWRKGKSVPQGDTLEIMCRLLKCSPAYLFGKTDDEITLYLIDVVASEIDRHAGDILRNYVAGLRAQQPESAAPPIEPWQTPPEPVVPSGPTPRRRGKRGDAVRKPR